MRQTGLEMERGVVRALSLLVLAGGESEEREISLLSGAAVAESLAQRGHRVRLEDPAGLPFRKHPQSILRHVDAVIPMVHGRGGEDGSLQRTLQTHAAVWPGCSAEAAELTFDKARTRERLLAAGVPVPRGFSLRRTDALPSLCHLRGQLVVKPARQGSSIGISIIQGRDELRAALDLAWSFSVEAIVEEYIPGREISVPVADDRILPAVEIMAPNGWYDFHSKYQSAETRYVVGPDSCPDEVNEIVTAASRVCGVTGLSRTDLRITSEGQIYVLEINTVPGMTSHSLVPMSAAAVGLSSGELLEQMLVRRMLQPGLVG